MNAEDAESSTTNHFRTPTTSLLDKNSIAPADVLYSIDGRLGVLAYNARVLCSVAVILICAYAVRGIMVSASKSESGTLSETANAVGMSFILVAMIATILILISAVKRVHDLNRSAWWLVLNLIPVVNIFWHLYYWFTPGGTEPNDFGPSRIATRLDKLFGIAGIFLMVYWLLKSINA